MLKKQATFIIVAENLQKDAVEEVLADAQVAKEEVLVNLVWAI